MRLAAFLICLIILLHSSALSAAQKPRPLAGIGILFIQPRVSERNEPASPISLYREPGLGHLADLDLSDFPLLAPAVNPPAGVYALAVTRKQGDWLKVVFDDSGREGWLSKVRGWDFQPWQRYLQGDEAKLFHGLKKEYYQLKALPNTSSQNVATLDRSRKLSIVELDGSWMLVLVDFETTGWLRWKDDDGRFLIVTGKKR